MNKKISTIITALILFVACSKNSSTYNPQPPPSNSCSSTPECIIASWNIESSSARLKNGSFIALYNAVASNNLMDYSGWNWQFTSDGKWTEYQGEGLLNDSGRYVITNDTLYTKGKYSHTYIISDINKSILAGYFVFDHADPDMSGVASALAAGIDTANFDGITAIWTK